MSHRLLAAFALMLAFIAPAALRAAPAVPDWARNATITPVGGLLVGNPDAKTKLVEYFSYTCPHCADFAKEAGPPLRQLVKGGAVSIEYRNFIRDGFDLTAALLARCGGPARFLANHDAILAGFTPWIAKVETYAKAHQSEEQPKDRSAQFIDIADKTGLTALAAKQGLPAATVRACMANKTALATILAMTAGAWDIDQQFEGTPTFLIDGKVVRGVHSWTELRPLLADAAATAK